jgi:hypothetical protein
MFNCKRCGFENKYKSKVIHHLKSKTPCSTILSNINRELLINILNEDKPTMLVDNNKLFICKYCKKVFKSATGKSIHSRKCKDNIKKDLSNNILINTINISNDLSTNIINNITNDLPTNIINNNSLINSNNTTNNISNMNNFFNNTINNNMININDVNNINGFLKHNEINSIFSFPSYSIGFLLENDFKMLLKQINMSREQDINPSTSYRSNYNLIMNILKELLMINDLRTKNLYINEVTDNHAYCLIDGKFYSIILDDLFNIIFSHMPNLVLYLLKLKDRFNGLNDKDKKYAKDACKDFNKFIEDNDKTEFKKMIVDCIYNNKFILEDLLNSAKPHEEINKNDDNTVSIHSRIINKLRKKLGIKPIDIVKNDILLIDEKDINSRFKHSIKIHGNNIELDNDEDEIIIDYDNTDTKRFSDGTICYKTKFKGVDIWYNETYNKGAICSKNERILYTKDILEKYINSMIDIINFVEGNKIEDNEINTDDLE